MRTSKKLGFAQKGAANGQLHPVAITNKWRAFTEPGTKRLAGHATLNTRSEVTGCYHSIHSPLNTEPFNSKPPTNATHKGLNGCIRSLRFSYSKLRVLRDASFPVP